MMRFDSARSGRSSRASSAVSTGSLTTSSGTQLHKDNLHPAVGRRVLSEEFQPLLKDFFHKEPCPYTHQIFQFAAIVFEALRHHFKDPAAITVTHPRRGHLPPETPIKPKTTDMPSIEFPTENTKRLTFQLVFQAMKYQRFLEDMLGDCNFFLHYPEFKEDNALVMVVLCDFKQRKFQKRYALPDDEVVHYICQIEDALFECRTKLNAALARSRIKARVLSIDHLLPDSVRKNEKIGSNMHVFGWVNFIKTSMEEVLKQLRDECFIEAPTDTKLNGKSYMVDNQCTDMLAFPYDLRETMEQHRLVQDHHIILQDKSSCVGPHSVRALINEGDDILHIHLGSGITTCHIASLTHNSDTVIYAVGMNSDKQHRQILNNLEKCGAKSQVKLLQENFLDIDHHDERLKHIKVVLLTAECSRSGVANPVNFIVSEGEDMSILRDLSLGVTDDTKLGELVVKHNTTLKHALRFPRVQAVVYCTRSLLEAENENVVTRSIEYVNMVQQKKTPFRIAPPVIPLSDRDIEMENPVNGKYLRYPPSNLMSGCFIATITREADDPKEAAKDILAKAAARGIISGIQIHKDEKLGKSKSKIGRRGEKSKGATTTKKSPSGTSARRTKSLPNKDQPGLRTVSKQHSFSSRLATPKSLHVVDYRSMSSIHPQVFQVPFNYGLQPHAQSASQPQISWPRSRTPPHEKVVKHPKPFK